MMYDQISIFDCLPESSPDSLAHLYHIQAQSTRRGETGYSIWCCGVFEIAPDQIDAAWMFRNTIAEWYVGHNMIADGDKVYLWLHAVVDDDEMGDDIIVLNNGTRVHKKTICVDISVSSLLDYYKKEC